MVNIQAKAAVGYCVAQFGAIAVWLCSGHADWAKGRYMNANRDVTEFTAMEDEVLRDDLLVNRLRAKG